jgi:copper transporter 1
MDMGGHDMGGAADGTPMCKISMLLNWYSIDACFLSDKWHIRSKAGFAGTLIGVFLSMRLSRFSAA